MILCINDHIAEMSEEQTERLLASLPEWRRAAALKFTHQQGRRECAAGYVELLRALRLRFGIDGMPAFAYNEHGKPFLEDWPDIHFSISHCKAAVGCLVSRHPCGLDIEHIRRAKPELVRYTMSPEEAEKYIAELALTQREILKNAARYARPGGRVLYSTCTVDPFENEQITEGFIAEHPGYSIEKQQQIYPSANGPDGFYSCVIRRSDDKHRL